MLTLDPTCQVILIDDDPHLRVALSQTFDLAGIKVQALESAEHLIAALPLNWPGVLVSDIRMPGLSGLELLQQAQNLDPHLPVLLITGQGDVPLAVEAMRQGAYDFLQKPFANEQLLESLGRALEHRQLVIENRHLRHTLAEQQLLGERLLGFAPSIKVLRQQISALAAVETDILIHGETGSGKEVVARALHDLSNRSNGPFVAINAGALAESVIESELFGHEAGAFTGAQKKRIGKFEFAKGGTVFLDEIESMSLDVQVKLLRLLQERVVERVGSNELIPLDVRIIAASKEDLLSAAEAGRFRHDLYYRLNVAQLHLPPLRNRKEDILILFQHFVHQACAKHQIAEPYLDANTSAQLLSHDWPGNVRELQNTAERWVLGLNLIDTPKPIIEETTALNTQVETFERNLLKQALSQTYSSMTELAQALQLPRKTLYDKLRKYGLAFQSTGAKPPKQE